MNNNNNPIENISLKEQFSSNFSDEDDNQRYNRFNNFLSSLAKKFNLDSSDIKKLCEMFLKGNSFEQIKQMAISLHALHQEKKAEACQRIADEKAGGLGEYHGYLGINNPKRRNNRDDLELDR